DSALPALPTVTSPATWPSPTRCSTGCPPADPRCPRSADAGQTVEVWVGPTRHRWRVGDVGRLLVGHPPTAQGGLDLVAVRAVRQGAAPGGCEREHQQHGVRGGHGVELLAVLPPLCLAEPVEAADVQREPEAGADV